MKQTLTFLHKASWRSRSESQTARIYCATDTPVKLGLRSLATSISKTAYRSRTQVLESDRPNLDPSGQEWVRYVRLKVNSQSLVAELSSPVAETTWLARKSEYKHPEESPP